MSEPLNDKINSLENRFNEHSKKIESKLDQIVTLMTTVTSLQERDNRHDDSIIELRSAIRDIATTTKEGIERIHQRLDNLDTEYSTHFREMTILVGKTQDHAEMRIMQEKDKIAIIIKDIQQDILTKLEKTIDRIETDEKNISSVDADVKKWINRGSGAWAIAAIFVTVLQFFGGYMINMIKEEYKTSQNAMQELQKRITENEQTTLQLWQVLREKSK